MHRLIHGTLLLAVAALTGCERYELDRQMEELCKKDGGIKVYETVTLPASSYIQMVKPGPYMPVAEDSWFVRVGPGDNYRHYTRREYIVGKGARHERGEGSLSRVHESIYRWPEKHLLGESVRYSRGGGDGFTFGFQPSGKSCPHLTRGLYQSVFIKRN